jgi:hypothetical protein
MFIIEGLPGRCEWHYYAKFTRPNNFTLGRGQCTQKSAILSVTSTCTFTCHMHISHICTCTFTCTCACACMSCTCTCACTCTHVHVHVHVHVCACQHVTCVMCTHMWRQTQYKVDGPLARLSFHRRGERVADLGSGAQGSAEVSQSGARLRQTAWPL